MINVLSIIEWLYLIIFESLIIFYSSHKVSHIVIWEYLIKLNNNISVNTQVVLLLNINISVSSFRKFCF
jgi:hypothetical protein